MEPISKPSIDSIVSDIKAELRNGKKMIYDLMQTMGNAINACIDWVNTNGAIMKTNEDTRISNEDTRISNENGRLAQEGSNDTTSEYYNMGRCKAERNRESKFDAMQDKFDTWESKIDDAVLCGDYNPIEVDCSDPTGAYVKFETGSGENKYFSIPVAGQEGCGLISAEDLIKLNNIEVILWRDDNGNLQIADCLHDFVTFPDASSTENGLMSADDKKKLDKFILEAKSLNYGNKVVSYSLEQGDWNIKLDEITGENLGASGIEVSYENGGESTTIKDDHCSSGGTTFCDAVFTGNKLTVTFKPEFTSSACVARVMLTKVGNN